MTTITVRYYGLISERVGKDREEFAVAEGACDVRALVTGRHPFLSGLTWQVAVDQHIVQGPVEVGAHSEILILPPFAGG